MKNWEFSYKAKNGEMKTINNENCWKNLEKDIWRGIAWCGDHLGVCLVTGGALLLAFGASKQKKASMESTKDEAPSGEIIFVDVNDMDKFADVLANNPQISVEKI